MIGEQWTRWLMQTARKWSDLEDIIERTGITWIDEDHKKLTEYALEINKLISILESDKFDLKYIEIQRETLEQLYDYTEHHFAHEERFMQAHNLPDTDLHRYQHRTILNNLMKVLDDFRNGRVRITLRLKLDLLDWVVGHINKVDFDAFQIENFETLMQDANSWEEINEIIRHTHIGFVDGDHIELIKACFELVEAVEAGRIGEVPGFFDRLINFTSEHFAREENLLKIYGRDPEGIHVKGHRDFLDQLDAYRNDWKGGEGVNAREIKYRFNRWLIEHTGALDYKDFNIVSFGPVVVETAGSWEEMAFLVRSTGNPTLDEDHRHLVELAIEIFDRTNIESFRDPAVIDATKKRLTTLYEICAAHFQREETIMKETSNPMLKEHARKHEQFLEYLRTVLADFSGGYLGLSTRLKAKLVDWIVHHTSEMDYKTFVTGGRP